MERDKKKGKKSVAVILGLCLFIAALTFKPSEPYLSQYLICNYESAVGTCTSKLSDTSCNPNDFCLWSADVCSLRPCSNVTIGECGKDDFNYCETDSGKCTDAKCYKRFSENQVNNDIYPWSTYAYLPFLLVLGPFAELYSYQIAILFGILGRVATRFLLLYGNSLLEMQLMQVVYSLGTAAEDVFSAYVYYVVGVEDYQTATSAIKAAALIASVLAGIVGDILVVEFSTSLRLLMWISAAFVWFGFFVGLFVIRPTSINTTGTTTSRHGHAKIGDEYDPSGATVYTAVDTHEQRPPQQREQGLPPLMKQTNKDDEQEDITLFQSPFTHTASMQADSLNESGGVSPERNSLPHSSVPSTPSSTTSSANIPLVGSTTRRSKLQRFGQQIKCLKVALQSRAMQAMLILWVLGNAVFTTLYDYEVSVYEELQGSNNWNGSVLAIMLLAGSFGALLPVNIKWSQFCASKHNEEEQSDGSLLLHRLDSELIISMRLMTAAILSTISLIFFALTWSLIPSITCLALFFATWQYINVIVYARFAVHLKLAESQVRLLTTVNNINNNNSYRRSDFSEEMYSPVHNTAAMPTVLQGFIDMDSSEEEGRSGHDRDANVPLNSSNFSPPQINLQLDTRSNPDRAGEHSSATQIDENEVDPPYSLAIVLIIAMNVVVQIILQSLLFSFLQSTLKFACWIMVLLFTATTAFYILVSVGWFGASSYYYEIRKWMRYSAPCGCVRNLC